MGRAPCCDKTKVKRGPWSPEEDIKLKEFIEKNGTGGNWIALPHKAGLKRCGKSCRLRWLNYLRPNIKHGDFSDDEDRIICTLFATIGSRWSIIAAQLPGRTDNDIKNYWNTKLKKKLLGIPPSHRKPNQQINQEQLLFQSSLENMTAVAPTSSSPQVLFHTNTVVPHQYQMKDSSSLLMFGGYEQSCSSSDGKEMELELGGGEEMGFENYLDGGNCGDEEAPLEYDYEEIKQQVSPNSGCNSLYVEDQCVATTDISFKTQLERGMHYYY